MVMDGKPYEKHNSTKAVEVFFQQKDWKKTYVEWKRSSDQNQKNQKSIRIYKKNPLMPGGNKKVTHTYTNLQLNA